MSTLAEFFPAENKEFTVGTRVVGLHGQPNISAASRTKKLHSWRASFELQQLLSHKPASYSVACSRHVDLPKECNSPSVILCHSSSRSYDYGRQRLLMPGASQRVIYLDENAPTVNRISLCVWSLPMTAWTFLAWIWEVCVLLLPTQGR